MMADELDYPSLSQIDFLLLQNKVAIIYLVASIQHTHYKC